LKKGKNKYDKEAKKDARDKQNIGKKVTFRSPSSFQELDTFSTQSDKFFHQDLSTKKHVSMKIMQGVKSKKKYHHAHRQKSLWTYGPPGKHRLLSTSSNAWRRE
jgi:hypothetical protein